MIHNQWLEPSVVGFWADNTLRVIEVTLDNGHIVKCWVDEHDTLNTSWPHYVDGNACDESEDWEADYKVVEIFTCNYFGIPNFWDDVVPLGYGAYEWMS